MISVFVIFLVEFALADIYLHNPRGSNDRNCERNVNRNNGNRMFDSQNNAKGGYACPRAVGDEDRQNEAGDAEFTGFTQNKKLYFYEGSVVPIEWTNQHGCGQNSKVNCEIVIQYMCSDTADPYVANFWPYTESKSGTVPFQAFASGANRAAPRDGIPRDENDAATDTIPDTEDAAIPDTQEDRRFGMHESYAQYQLCQRTERNKGLYTADQRVRRNDMRGTRQNPNGDRRGLECPEERDYYPHWSPSPWIDIAVLTNDAQEDVACTDPTDPTCSTRCRYYLENSFNKNTKSYCDVPHEAGVDVSEKFNSQAWQSRQWYNNQEACEANGFVWYNVTLDDILNGMEYPMCAQTQFSRVNQLGNAIDTTIDLSTEEGTDVEDDVPQAVNANRLLWTVPRIPEPKDATSYYQTTNNADGMADAYASCTLRLRYNISTSDFPAWPADAMDDDHPWKYAMVTAANNSNGNEDNPNTPLYQDPYVYLGAGDDADKDDMFVSLAVNTNQYARTFQDRTYTFSIRRRPTTTADADDQADTPAIPAELVAALDPANTDGARVYNVNVRGKRGNIVQTYPSVEYDFTPNSLALNPNDVVHFQWTGSDYNPRRGCNDAEGGPPDPNDFVSEANANQNSRADRSNVVFMNAMAENVPMDMAGYAQATASAEFAARTQLSQSAILEHTPCTTCEDINDPTCDTEEAQACVDLIRRLAFLNQQSDGGALELRQGNDCLTEEELDNIDNKATRENHPLNCAKLNAKPFPYFDAGAIVAKRSGMFAFFSSRNNNFSNRDQTGILCVREAANDDTCPLDSNNVLQDQNPAIATAALGQGADESASRCIDEASDSSIANAQGASSCIASADAEDDILTEETQTNENKDNDALGDGNIDPCDIIFWSITNNDDTNRIISYLTLAIVLLFVGIIVTYLSYYSYNRYKAHQEEKQKFKEGADWKNKKETEMM